MSVSSAILRKTVCELRNAGRILRKQSAFQWFFVFCFAVACEAGLWYIFLDGFRFLDQFGGFGGLILGRLFSLFFLGLGAMLALSSIVASYSTIFRSPETDFLMARPLSVSQIVVYKFLEATALSSWAFFFVIVPFVGAYARFARLSVFFAAWTLLFSLPFLILCSGVGTLFVMLFVRWFPAGRLRKVCGWGLALAAAAVLRLMSRHAYDASDSVQFTLSRLVPGMVVASNVLVPSSWMAEGIVAFSDGRWLRGVLMWAMLASTALVAFMAVEWMGSRMFYDCWQRARVGSQVRRRTATLLAWLDAALQFVAGDLRALVMKDIRTFFRDALQWSQAMVFFGLLALYFANLGTLRHQVLGGGWHNMMVFLNVFSVSSVVCSLGARFVYPQLSLEGQEFWILGLSPTTMKRILLTKFAMAAGSMLVVSVVLVLLSSSKLQTTAAARVVTAALVAAVTLAVCGLSAGLGAVFLDLRQRNPAAIVSGFGGTLNLVLSLGFMLVAILPFAAVFHLQALDKVTAGQFKEGVAWASVWLAVITTAATLAPLKLGIRSLRKRDF